MRFDFLQRTVTNSPKETYDLAFDLGKTLKGGEVLLLHGDLGAGKTVFSKGIAAGIGVRNEVVSPTFVILKEYHGTVLCLYHIDMYRIESEKELENIGIDELFADDSVVIIEWNLYSRLPTENVIDVFFKVLNYTSREISFNDAKVNG